MNIVAQRLRDFRDSLGYSQQGIAASVDMEQTVWSRWERKPPEALEHLRRIAGKYGVSADYLLGLTDDPNPVRGEALPEPVREVVALSVAWPEARQQELLDVALVLDAAERDANLREYDRIMGLLEAVSEGDLATDAIESALRADAAGDRAAALRLIDAFFAGRAAREEAQEDLHQV